MGLFGFRKNSRQDSGISKMNYIEKNNYISSFILAAYNKLKNEEDEPVKAAMYLTLNLIYRDSEKLSKNAYYIRATKTNDITAHNIFMEAGIAPFVIMLEFLEPDDAVHLFVNYIMLIEEGLDSKSFFYLKETINKSCFVDDPNFWPVAQMFEMPWFKLLEPNTIEHLSNRMRSRQ